MADRRPRNQRPRSRGGKNRLAQQAAAERQNAHISALQEALEPAAHALAATTDPESVVDAIRQQATTLASQRTTGDVASLVEATLDEIFGLGPLEPVLRDPAVRVIRIEGAQVFGQDEPVRGLRDVAHAQSVLSRILAAVGRSFDDGPVEVEMLDGSRLEARLVDGAPQAVLHRPPR